MSVDKHRPRLNISVAGVKEFSCQSRLYSGQPLLRVADSTSKWKVSGSATIRDENDGKRVWQHLSLGRFLNDGQQQS